MNLIQKIISLFETKKQDLTESAVLIQELSQQVRELRLENVELKRKIKESDYRRNTYVFVAGFDDLSHEPTDAKERQIYCGRVSEFYDDVLKAKIRTSISEIRETLAAVGIGVGLPQNMTRSEYDYLLRGMEAGLWKIHDWATILQGELKNK